MVAVTRIGRNGVLVVAVALGLAACSDDANNDAEAGRRFCERLDAGESLTDIALSEPVEHPPGEYEDLVAERVRRFCPAQAADPDVQQMIEGPNLTLVDGTVVIEQPD